MVLTANQVLVLIGLFIAFTCLAKYRHYVLKHRGIISGIQWFALALTLFTIYKHWNEVVQLFTLISETLWPEIKVLIQKTAVGFKKLLNALARS